ATIAHIRGTNAVAITGAVTFFPNVLLGLTSANIILAQELDEDWTVARGQPTNAVLVVPNAKEGVSIIFAGIRSGQRLFLTKKHFPSTDRYLRIFEIGDQLGYTLAQKKTQFMSRVRDDIKKKIYRIGQHRPINNIFDNLAELELRCRVLGPPPSYLSYILVPPAISNKTPPPISSKNIEQLRYLYKSNNPFDGPPVLYKSDKLCSARIDRLESIMGKIADTVSSVADSVEQLTNQLGKMSLNDQSRKPFYCSNCGQEGHKKIIAL
ncbi:24313_t:CDS:2, partial [Racocetra persica]